MSENEGVEVPPPYNELRDGQIYFLKERLGMSVRDIAEQECVSESYVRGGASRYRKTYVFGIDEEPDVPLPSYTGSQHIAGDALVIGDLHLPTTDYSLLSLALRVAHKHLETPRTLILAGDMLNMDAVSDYKHLTPPIALQTEIKAGRKVMRQLLRVFDKVYYFMGNHDVRLHKQLDGTDLLGGVFSEFGKRLTISPYPYMRVTSGGEDWHVTHPRNYSRNKLITANKLAQKHQMNVISWHEHHAAKGRDEYNRYTIINGGGLFEPNLMAYVSLNDSTSPVMSKGFVLLKNGVGHLITPYPTMTDLSIWLGKARK